MFLKLARPTAGLDLIYIKISSEPVQFTQSEPQRYGHNLCNTWSRISVTKYE